MSDFVYVTYIYTTPQKVWDAITRPEFARRYWMHYNVSDWKPGSRWEHQHGDDSGKILIDGTVLESDPPPAHLILPLRFDTLLRGDTYGVEVLANLNPTRRWRLSGGYSYLGLRLSHKLLGHDPNTESLEDDDPRHQFQFHSYLRFARGLELDNSLYHVSPLLSQQIPAYTRLDARFGWKVRERFELSLELDVLHLATLEIAAQVVQFDHPLVHDGLDRVGQQSAAEQRLDQAVGQERAQHLVVERPSRFEFHARTSEGLLSCRERPPWRSLQRAMTKGGIPRPCVWLDWMCGAYPTAPTTSEQLCPPKPKLFDTAIFTSASRASFGT